MQKAKKKKTQKNKTQERTRRGTKIEKSLYKRKKKEERMKDNKEKQKEEKGTMTAECEDITLNPNQCHTSIN